MGSVLGGDMRRKGKKKIGHHARPQAGIGHSAPKHMHRTGLLVLQSGPS